MRTFILSTALLAAGLAGATAARAQDATTDAAASDNGTSFRGLRAEGQIGGDRFQSQGVHDNHFGYGAAVGFDGTIGNKIVIGPEFSYWHSGAQNVTQPLNGTYADKSFRELGAGVRLGYLVRPKILVYGIGGYVNDKERVAFTGPNNSGTAGAFYHRVNADGYQLGAGAEYSITKLAYVGAGYRYSNYDDHTARQRVFLSAGIHFKP